MSDEVDTLNPPPTDGNAAAPAKPTAAAKPLPRGPFPLDIPVLTTLRGKRVILASASPQRRQLLSKIGLTNLEIQPSTKPENLSKTALSPFEYVLHTASQKCLDVYETACAATAATAADPALVISADTVIVTTAGRILEKPRSEAEHLAMLRMLRDQGAHRVFTAVCVLAPREDARHPGYSLCSGVEETKVVFDKHLGDEMIEAYVKTREATAMAGGYGIQGMGSLLVERIEGAYDNVVGLPVRATLKLMEKALFKQDDEEEKEEEED